MAGVLNNFCFASLRLVPKRPETDPLTSPLMALLQPMHFMPPTTSRSFQTSASKTQWNRQCWDWLSGQVHSMTPPQGYSFTTLHSALSKSYMKSITLVICVYDVWHVQCVPVRHAHHSRSAVGLRGFYQWPYVQWTDPATHGHPKTGQQECPLLAWAPGRHQR